MSIPNWWEAVLLGLASWRIFNLLAFDDILDWPRRYVTRLGKEWGKEGDAVPVGYRFRLGLFISCPACLGFWVTLAFWGLWEVWPHSVLVVSVPLALSAAVIGAHKILASD